MSSNPIITDVLVIGAGLAGLCAAYEAHTRGARVAVVSKGPHRASPDIMGFNAPVDPRDSAEQYYQDILQSGCSVGNTALARILAEESEAQIYKMESLGLTFARNEDGTYNQMQALGNTYPRIVHYKALTGAKSLELLEARCRAGGVTFFDGVRITRLLTQKGKVVGAAGLRDSGESLAFGAGAVVLATGGCGSMHPVSTYPAGLMGDGYARTYRAGAELVDLEFLQFEPCVFVHPPELRGNLIVTTMLNEGGKLLNGAGEEFLVKSGEGYRLQKSQLSRRIVREIREGKGTPHGGILYDVTALPYKRLAEDHSIFYDPAKRVGIDLSKVPGEVAPAAHTFLGGVKIDTRCASTAPGLYAAGEVAGGVHGANRLGGCAGAEVYVFGFRAGQWAGEYAKASGPPAPGDIARLAGECQALSQNHKEDSLSHLYDRVREAVAQGLGLFREESAMRGSLEKLETLEAELENSGAVAAYGYHTCRNAVDVAKLQLAASLERRESRGVFYRTDYPQQDDEGWKGNIILQKDGGTHTLRVSPAQ